MGESNPLRRLPRESPYLVFTQLLYTNTNEDSQPRRMKLYAPYGIPLFYIRRLCEISTCNVFRTSTAVMLH
ncbi:MAG: hypothetical protein II288_05605, partial [Alistipes sp.]|nr:hypothetical protein [Alistipes sp.]